MTHHLANSQPPSACLSIANIVGCRGVMWSLMALLIFCYFPLPAEEASTNAPSVGSTQALTNHAAEVSSSEEWLDEDFTKNPQSKLKKMFRESTSDSGAFFGLIQIILAILIPVLGIVWGCLKMIFKINIFALFPWMIGLFSYKMRLRRFLKALKGHEIECNPYISIDRSCLKEAPNIINHDRLPPGVFFFFGQRDVGKKALLVGEFHYKDMSVVLIPECKWLGEGYKVCHEELLEALGKVFPPLGLKRKKHLVLVLDSQTKDCQGFRQILEQVKNSLYLKLPEGIRKHVSIVIKMIGMYAARDIRDIHSLMIEPLSASECAAFSNVYCQMEARRLENATTDEHVLYVNSMGHPSRIIKYLEGNSSNDTLGLDIIVLDDWDDHLDVNAEDSLRKKFYCLIYILAIVDGCIDLDLLIELILQQTPDSKEFSSLKKAIVSIVGRRIKFDAKQFNADALFENLQEERFLIAWRAGSYDIGSRFHFADVLPTVLERCSKLLSSSSVMVYGEDFSRRMIAACTTDWQDISRNLPSLIQMFERMNDVRLRHDIGMHLIAAAYRYEWCPRFGIAEEEDLAEQIRLLLHTLQEMRWPGWLDAMLLTAPLLCLVKPDISKWDISDSTIEAHLQELASDNRLPKNLQNQIARGLAALYCYSLITISLRTCDRTEIVSKLQTYRTARARIWEWLDNHERIFVLRLHNMLVYARVTEQDNVAFHGEWSDRRCEAIREFLKSASQMKHPEFFGVIQLALQSQFYNLFLSDKNKDIISELIQFWEQFKFAKDESKKEFLWTLKWYKACSEATEVETPDDVLTVVDNVISELDLSGNKCLSGNPQTVVDMMWLVSSKLNDLYGLKECADGISRLQRRMMNEVKRWCPILCMRARLRFLLYFSRVLSKFSLADEEISWLVSELREIYHWINRKDKLLWDRDTMYSKILKIIFAMLLLMNRKPAFANGGICENEAIEITGYKNDIIKLAKSKSASAVLKNDASEILLFEGNMVGALICTEVIPDSDATQFSLVDAVIAISPRKHPRIFTWTAYLLFSSIMNYMDNMLSEEYDDYMNYIQNEPEGQDKATKNQQLWARFRGCKMVAFSILQKVASPLAGLLNETERVPDVGDTFYLHNRRSYLEVDVLKKLVLAYSHFETEHETIHQMSVKHLNMLIDAGDVMEAVQLCGYIMEKYTILIDGDSFVKIYNRVKETLMQKTPLSLAEKRKRYETIYSILSNKEFVERLKVADMAELSVAWREMRAGFTPDGEHDNLFMDLLLISQKLQKEMTQIDEDAYRREYVGKSQDGKISISLYEDEVTSIACEDETMEIDLYLDDVKQAFNMAIEAKHKWRKSQKDNLMMDIFNMSKDLGFSLPEDFESRAEALFCSI